MGAACGFLAVKERVPIVHLESSDPIVGRSVTNNVLAGAVCSVMIELGIERISGGAVCSMYQEGRSV